MPSAVILARWEVILLIGAYLVVILWKLLTGGVNLKGLLKGDRHDGTEFFSPGRAQMLVFTIGVALHYLIQVLENPSSNSLPSLPQSVVAALAGSQSLYLGGKAWSLRNVRNIFRLGE